ncbi:MAG: PD-(D/E)XK nuclease family protein, partial [Oscillospiraceae bacterium]|nr:PD-(D/E)XK nuclease family protein [Oscillospiraceae bacterium]
AEAAAARLQKTEEARRRLQGWFEPYFAAGKKRGAALLRQAWALAERCGAVENIQQQHAPGRKNAQLAFSMVERLHMLLGDEDLSREELCDMLRLLAANTKAQQIPPVMDGVLIGGADRSMPYNPRASFLLGVNDGQFPRDDFEGLLLTLEERDLLYENELILAGSFDECCDMEAWFLYAAAAAPSERVYFSYSAGEAGANALPPSAELLGFCRAYGIAPMQRAEAAGIVNLRTARARYGEAAVQNDLLRDALLQSAAAESCRALDEALQRKPFEFRDASLARQLLGRQVRLSASKIETYSSCPFRYFVRYMLGVNPLQKVEMSASEAGNLVHEVMEKLMQQMNGDLTAASMDELKAACKALAEAYMDGRLPREKRTPRLQALADQLGDAVLRLALRLRAEQQQSRFRAADCELAVGRFAEVPAAVYPLADGSSAVVEGVIDRVDVYEEDGVRYVRVVDYKTGKKEFRLSDVWQGLNIQMLLYLFALKNNAGERYGGSMTPAGVLYLPSDPKPADSEKDAKKIFRMNGILLDDPLALAAMEEKGEGIYIPTSLKSGGWDPRNLATAALFGSMERRIGEIITEMGDALREGKVDACPAQKGSEPEVCRYCDYRAVCCAERVSRVRKIENLDVKKILQEREEQQNG